MFGLNEAQIGLLMRTNRLLREYLNVLFPAYTREGTKADGDFKPTSNVTLNKEVYNWNDVVIPSGVTVITASRGLLAFANKIEISGLLTASGKGALGGTAIAGTGAGLPGQDSNGVAGGGGGAGGTSNAYAGGKGGDAGAKGGLASGGAGKAFESFPYLPEVLFTLVGAGGGASGAAANDYSRAGGPGGGYIIIICNQIIINAGGAVRAEGINGTNGDINRAGGGGGGGGIVVIDALSGSVVGTISVTGGLGGASGHNPGGKGGDGAKYIIIREAT